MNSGTTIEIRLPSAVSVIPNLKDTRIAATLEKRQYYSINGRLIQMPGTSVSKRNQCIHIYKNGVTGSVHKVVAGTQVSEGRIVTLRNR